MAAVYASRRGVEASAWAWLALVATLVSALGYALQTILDYVPSPATLDFAVFWGLFAADAVVAFLAGMVAVVQGRRSQRNDRTIAFGLIGIGWLVLAQGIQLVWN